MADQDDPFSGLDIQAAPRLEDTNPLAGLDLRAPQQQTAPAPAPQRHNITKPANEGISAEEEQRYRDMPWLEGVSSMAQHAVPSFTKGVSEFAHFLGDVVNEPSTLLEAAKQTAQGAYSKASGALGGQREPEKERFLDAIMKVYEGRYGSWGKFKHSLFTDPFSVGMDVSVPLTMGAGALPRSAGLVGKAASVAGTLMDPIQSSLAVAKGIGKGAGAVMRSAQGLSTGVSPNLLKVATEAGSTSDPVLRGAFLSHLSGKGDPAEMANALKQSVKEIRGNESAAYLAERQRLGASNNSVDVSALDAAIADTRQKYGQIPGTFSPANRALDEAEMMVNNYKNLPASEQTLERLDNLKQAIWDLRDQTGNNAAQDALMNIYHGARNSLVAHDAGYADLMDRYTKALDNIKGLTSGLGANAATPSTVARMLKATKTSMGQSLLDQIANTQSGRTVPYMLAGHALHSYTPGGARGLLDALLMYGSAAVTPHMAWGILASSPRAMGTLNYALGAAGKRGAPLISKPVTYGAYQLEGAMGDGGPQAPQAPEAPHIDRISDAIHQQESGGGRNLSTSVTGARGDMQIQPQTFAQYALPGEHIDSRQDNIRVGRRIIQDYARKFGGDPARIAVAYFSGPGNVAPPGHSTPWLQDRSDPTGKSTSSYVRDILGRLQAGQAATGGRIERREGGRVGIDHRAHAATLVRAAEAAKKQESRKTEPLLEAPDEHIVKALSLANEAI